MNASKSKPTQVLVLCTGNSARSILGETLVNHYGKGQWHAYSAGSQPKGAVHPLALQTLHKHGIDTSGVRSKSWDEFAGEHAPNLDIVITVCDNAAGEVCPVWHGAPVKAHWGIPDPAGDEGTLEERLESFEVAFTTLEKRIKRLVELPVATLDRETFQTELRKLAVIF